MNTQFLGEIRMFAGMFAPLYWFFCDGRVLPIAEYPDLFNLIGTTYGGDGQTTFALPDLSGRVPVHASQEYVLGEKGGSETVTLQESQAGAHTHALVVTQERGTAAFNATNGYLAATPGSKVYALAGGGMAGMAAQAMDTRSGGNQPHENMAPFLAINFIIATTGIYPSPN